MMKKTITLCSMLAFALTSFGQWTTIITDASGDASGSGLDGTVLEYQYDEPNDEVLFRITCTNLSVHSGSPSADFSFALPNGLASGAAAGAHWTSITSVHKTAASYADPGGTAPSNYTFTSMGAFQNQIIESGNSSILCTSNCHDINVDVSNNQITYTFDRSAIITDTEMAGNSATIGLVMNVGDNVAWRDAITHSQGGASTSTFTITKTVVGIKDLGETREIGLFPNPASNILYLDSDTKLSKVIVYDVTGKEIVKYTSNQLNKIDVSNLKEGIYILSTYGNNHELIGTNKFIKQ